MGIVETKEVKKKEILCITLQSIFIDNILMYYLYHSLPLQGNISKCEGCEKLTSQLRLSMTFSVGNINFMKTVKIEAVGQNIPGLNKDSSSLKIPIYIYTWYKSLAS